MRARFDVCVAELVSSSEGRLQLWIVDSVLLDQPIEQGGADFELNAALLTAYARAYALIDSDDQKCIPDDIHFVRRAGLLRSNWEGDSVPAGNAFKYAKSYSLPVTDVSTTHGRGHLPDPRHLKFGLGLDCWPMKGGRLLECSEHFGARLGLA